ncbi:unnamed protein product [Linum tenue]|uniref:Uncharacterized protein n=1 Tax=Linum tenue TaxID=586396 RepID=A0AAV0RE97_9ROSI|nr:unnamed protein product [Linum tenue]
MNHIRAFLSAGSACLRRARPTNATEGAQFSVARWLIDGKVSVRNGGAEVTYPRLRLSPAAAEADGWGVAEVEIRQPDGTFATSKFHVEILTRCSDAPGKAVMVSKEQIDEVVAVQKRVFDQQKEIELFCKDAQGKLAAVLEDADLTQLGEKKSDASP